MSILDPVTMRLRSLFGGDQQPTPDTAPTTMGTYQGTAPMNLEPTPTNVPVSPDEKERRNMEFYRQLRGEPEHAALDKMNEMITKMPQRPHPGIIRRVLAGTAQALGGGPSAYDQIAYGGYNRDMADWVAHYKPLKELADTERSTNTSNDQFAKSIMAGNRADDTLGYKYDALAETQRARMEREANNRAQTAIKDYNSKHPRATFQVDKNGKVVAIDPITHKAETVMMDDGTELTSDKVSPATAQQYKLDLINAREHAGEKLEGVRQGNREKLVQERTQARQQAATKDKNLSVGQDAAAWKLARQQYIADNPHHSDFWDTQGLPNETAIDDDTGTYENAVRDITDRYNRIKSRAGGKTTPAAPAPKQESTTGNDQAPKAPKGWKYVKSADGKHWTAVKDTEAK